MNVCILCRIYNNYACSITHDKKNPRNLHKNSLFSEKDIIINVIVVESYKWCFKKQFLSLVKHRYSPRVWQKTKALGSEYSLLQYWHLIHFSWSSGMWVGPSQGMDGLWGFYLLVLLMGNDLLRLMYLPIKAYDTTFLKFTNDTSLQSFV